VSSLSKYERVVDGRSPRPTPLARDVSDVSTWRGTDPPMLMHGDSLQSNRLNEFSDNRKPGPLPETGRIEGGMFKVSNAEKVGVS
jgi:hypothetical protein